MKRWLLLALKGLAVLVGLVVILLLGVVVYIQAVWDRPTTEPAHELRAPQDAVTLARGDYLYNRSMLCWTCHGSKGGYDQSEPQAGGRRFDLSDVGPGFGVVWGSNLTADRETGLGAATDGQLVRAIREGVSTRGRVIFPVMAYQFYHGLSDDDALALVAYLRTLRPVANAVPDRELSFVAKALIAFGMIKPEAPIAGTVIAPARSATVEYGRYLTWNTSGCAECHTPRFPENGQLDTARLMGGGLFALVEPGFTTTGPNLTPDQETGLGGWSEAQFIQAVRTGVRPDGTVMLPFMPWPSYSTWSDEDVHAIWLYLRSVAPVSHRTPRSTLTGRAAAGRGLERGGGLFSVYCVACHGEGGRGGSLTAVALRDAAREVDDTTLRNVVVDGLPGTAMPGFGRTLDPDQVDDVVAFIRSW
jgi:mono/diheme cytochrome c family protein